MKYYGDINLQNNQLQNATIQSGTSLPSTSSVILGELFYLTGGSTPGLYIFNGTAWGTVSVALISKLSQLTNDVGFITVSAIPTKVSAFTNDAGYLTTVSLPTKLSQLTNDTGFITASSLPTELSQLTNNAGFITSAALPTKVSQLTNDAGYATLASPQFIGAPTAPTAADHTNSTQLATTAFVQNALNIVTSVGTTWAGFQNFTGCESVTVPTEDLTYYSADYAASTQYVYNATQQACYVDVPYSIALDSEMFASPILHLDVLASGPSTVTFPNTGTWQIYNNATNATLITCNNTYGGATVVLPPGQLVTVVSLSIYGMFMTGGVNSFNGRYGAVSLLASDIANAGGAAIASPAFTGVPTAPTPTAGNNSTQIATTAFIQNIIGAYAPIASPAFTGVPTAPTATAGTNTIQIATTAFVQNAVSAIASGLVFRSTWNANTNSPNITSGSGTVGWIYKVSVAGSTTVDGCSTWSVGDLLIFDGTVWDKIDGQSTEVVSFNGRVGAITLLGSDVTTALGYTPVNPASAALTGSPTAPTPSAGTNNTQIATTAFVANLFSGYASLSSPALTGTPTAPTATSGTNSTQLATTAFVQNAVAAAPGPLAYQGTWNANTNAPTLASGTGTKGTLYKVSVAGTTTLDGNASWSVGDLLFYDGTTWDKINGQATQVISFNSRTGAITLTSTDVTNALGFTPANSSVLTNYALLASPSLTGTPTAPTPTSTDNSTKIATTAYVQAAISNGGGGGGGSTSIYSFFPGNIAPLTGALRYYPETTITLSQISLFVNTSPTTPIIVDLKKNGTSLFSGSKPTISPGSNVAAPISLNSTTLTSSDYLTIDIDQGNGADMTARIDHI